MSETTSLTHSLTGKLEEAVPLAEVTGETSDISEYLDFGFYEKIWFKDNAGVSPVTSVRGTAPSSFPADE